jgi:integrase
LAKFVSTVEKGEFIMPANIKFGDFAIEWLEIVKSRMAKTTHDKYKGNLERHLLPYFKNDQMEKIHPLKIMKFYNCLKTEDVRLDGKKGGLVDRKIKDIHELLTLIYNDALTWEVITKSPMANVKAPKVVNKEIKIYQTEDIKPLIEALNKETVRNRIIIYLASFGMFRKGEITGIDWSDVLFNESKIKIQKSQIQTAGEIILKETKGNKIRIINLPDFVIDDL